MLQIVFGTGVLGDGITGMFCSALKLAYNNNRYKKITDITERQGWLQQDLGSSFFKVTNTAHFHCANESYFLSM